MEVFEESNDFAKLLYDRLGTMAMAYFSMVVEVAAGLPILFAARMAALLFWLRLRVLLLARSLLLLSYVLRLFGIRRQSSFLLTLLIYLSLEHQRRIGLLPVKGVLRGQLDARQRYDRLLLSQTCLIIQKPLSLLV